ncbi:MAG: hypothetical protein K6D02_01820 [Lachnospiraceae bacterium]|nr:hypothetical protein [Lachnospiraceae bacterium]
MGPTIIISERGMLSIEGTFLSEKEAEDAGFHYMFTISQPLHADIYGKTTDGTHHHMHLVRKQGQL